VAEYMNGKTSPQRRKGAKKRKDTQEESVLMCCGSILVPPRDARNHRS
jgi:hypothetical protein